MKYEMTALESACLYLQIEPPDFNAREWKEALLQEKIRVLQNFLRVTMNTESDRQLNRYLKAHRKACEQLTKHIEEIGDSDTTQHKRKSLVRFFIQCINDILAFIDEQLEAQDNAIKLVTTLSVKELALWFRLLEEEDIIKVAQKRDLTRFVNKNIRLTRSSESEVLSEEYFYNSLYKSTPAVVEAVSSMLYKMRVRVNKLRSQS